MATGPRGHGPGSSPDPEASERAGLPTLACRRAAPRVVGTIDFDVAAPDLEVPPLPEEARRR